MTDRSTTQHPTAPPDIDAYLARFGWHPEPELVAYRDEGASRDALARLGADTWETALAFLYEQASIRAMGDASPYDEIRRRYYGGGSRSRPRAGRPDPVTRHPRGVRAAAGRRADGVAAPAAVRLLHAAAARDVDDGRAARPDGQPGRRCLARRPARLLRRGGGGPLAVRPRRLRRRVVRAAHVRRRDGQLHGHGDRPRPAPRPDPRGRAPAARRRAGPVPRLRQRPDPLLGRAGARPPRLPERHPRDRAVRRRVPAPRRARRRGGRSRPGRGAHAVRDLGSRGLHEHRLGRRHRRAGGRRRGERPVAPRRRGLRRRRLACRSATPAASRTSIAPIR